MPAVFNRFGSGYTDFKRASTDNWTIGFQKDKKKLTDIGFFRLWSFVRIGSEFNGSGFLRTLD